MLYKKRNLYGFVVGRSTPVKSLVKAEKFCNARDLPLCIENVRYDVEQCKELSKNRIDEIDYLMYHVDKEIKDCEKRIQTHVDKINNNTSPNDEKELTRKYLLNEQGQFHSLIIVKDILLKRKWELYEISRLKKEL